MFLRTFLPYNSHSVTYCSCFCVHSSASKERVGGGYYCIRRVLGRHLAWYWSRNARILVRSYLHTHTQSHALQGETHELSVCEFFRCEVYGGGDCLENGDATCVVFHLLWIQRKSLPVHICFLLSKRYMLISPLTWRKQHNFSKLLRTIIYYFIRKFLYLIDY